MMNQDIKKYDVAAYIWPAYTGDEPRTRIFWPEGIGEWQSVKNIQETLQHKPKEMSGGQQQRVGIARAFVAKPSIVFADEPTGNLDTRTTMEVMELIRQIARDNHQTIVMVTHDRELAQYADRVIRIIDGKVREIETKKEETNVEEEINGTVCSADDSNRID